MQVLVTHLGYQLESIENNAKAFADVKEQFQGLQDWIWSQKIISLAVILLQFSFHFYSFLCDDSCQLIEIIIFSYLPLSVCELRFWLFY